MSRLTGLLHHGVALVVDDRRLALATAAWLVLAGTALPRWAGGTPWEGPILFTGLAAILLENAIGRAARPN